MFERSSTIIRDPSKLDYDYVPAKLIHREEQMKVLETLFRPLAEHGRSCSAFLTGSVGTGKTATAKRFCADLADYMGRAGKPLDTVFVNCRNSTEAGTVLQMVRHFDRGFPDRGFSVDDMIRTLGTHINANRRGVVFVLDEVDILLKKGSTDLIYMLTRTPVEGSAPVNLILIAQSGLAGLLDEASISTFRRTNGVRFERYSEGELREIVAARAEEALYPGRITEDSLDQIAQSAAEFGDARMAIELLDRAANIAEGEVAGEVTVENVRAAKAMIYSSVSESKLSTLDVNRMAVLLAIARAMKQNLSIPTTAAEKTYAIVCEEYGLTARKHTQFWKYLQDLEKHGTIRMRITDSPGGRSASISLPDIPSKVLASKMEALIESALREEDDEVRSLRP